MRRRAVGISLDPKIADELRDRAAALGISQGNLIARLLRESSTDLTDSTTAPELLERLSTFLPKVSGVSMNFVDKDHRAGQIVFGNHMAVVWIFYDPELGARLAFRWAQRVIDGKVSFEPSEVVDITRWTESQIVSHILTEPAN